jgi:hypothetical protein
MEPRRSSPAAGARQPVRRPSSELAAQRAARQRSLVIASLLARPDSAGARAT